MVWRPVDSHHQRREKGKKIVSQYLVVRLYDKLTVGNKEDGVGEGGGGLCSVLGLQASNRTACSKRTEDPTGRGTITQDNFTWTDS